MAGLYLHIPYCEHKCIYCDFYSIESRATMDDFLRALRQEIGMYAARARGETFGTIFFGGGTPSLLSPPAVGEIMQCLASAFEVAPDAEVTLEANPGTIDPAKLRALRACGVNRLSYGVQSFDDGDLRFLTRIHSSKDARDAVRMAKESGFENINVDMIYSLPGQSLERWKRNIESAVALGTPHLSAYSLIIETGTPLAGMVRSGQVSTLPTELEARMYEWTMSFLRSAGFDHYEVSNYARPGFASLHNRNYWNHTNYLGFGPSAHSYWNDERWWNVRSIEGYCRQVSSGTTPVAGKEKLSARQKVDEIIMLGLRSEGIDLPSLAKDFGIDLVAGGRGLADALAHQGYCTITSRGRLRLTDRGFLICDEICRRMIDGSLS